MRQSVYQNKYKEDRDRNAEPLTKTLKRWAIVVSLFGLLALIMKIFGAL